MGNGIAHVFAQHGFNVQLIDISEDSLKRGMSAIEKNLGRMVTKGVLDTGKVEQTLSNIKTTTDLAQGVKSAELVVEAATEDISLKKKIFRELDAHCPEDTILATNTSSISITEIGAVTNRASQVIGMHFMTVSYTHLRAHET